MKDRMFYEERSTRGSVLEGVGGSSELARSTPAFFSLFSTNIFYHFYNFLRSLSPLFLYVFEPAFRNLFFLSLQTRRACGLGSSFSNQLTCHPRLSSSPVPREVGNQFNPPSLMSISRSRPLEAKQSLRTAQVSVSQSRSFSSPRLNPTTWL